jgi:predicted NBD/HSP70 family sugar kinase
MDQSLRAQAAIQSPGSDPADRIVLVLRQQGTLSRAEIARRTGMARSTVSETVRVLIDQGLIIEGQVQRTGKHGRPAIGISLNPRAGTWIGLDFGQQNVRGVIVDVSHEILAAREVAPGADYGPDAGLDAAVKVVVDLLAASNTGFERVVGVAAAVPGPVDPQSGRILGTRLTPRWTGVELARDLQARLGCRVLVENDSNCAALAEHSWGAGRANRDLVVLKLDSGVGGGVIVGNELVRGVGGLAGEFGHMTVEPGGPLCPCGGRGCLEALVGIPAILEQMRSVKGEMTFGEFVELVASGDRPARRVILEAADRIGRAIANILITTGPDLVILSGALTRVGEPFLGAVRESFEQYSITGRQGLATPAQVVLGTLGRDACALGAVVLLLSGLGLDDRQRPVG